MDIKDIELIQNETNATFEDIEKVYNCLGSIFDTIFFLKTYETCPICMNDCRLDKLLSGRLNNSKYNFSIIKICPDCFDKRTDDSFYYFLSNIYISHTTPNKN